MITPASTSTPIAMAIPPRDMMLEVTPINFMVMKAISTEIGRVSTITRALWKCSRKTRMTSETTTDSSIRLCFKVSMARSIRSERS
jgi:hypothetical protein